MFLLKALNHVVRRSTAIQAKVEGSVLGVLQLPSFCFIGKMVKGRLTQLPRETVRIGAGGHQGSSVDRCNPVAICVGSHRSTFTQKPLEIATVILQRIATRAHN
jgi:hypothetical protein